MRVQPFHRTISLDFAIVTHGTVTCIFDDGAKVTLGPGDVLVQRGTIHAWQVEGDEWVRMHTFMLRTSAFGASARAYTDLGLDRSG